MKKLIHILITDGNTAGGIEEYFYRILKFQTFRQKPILCALTEKYSEE